jgi:hypothetical protein
MDAAVVVGRGNVVCGGAGDFDSMNEMAAGVALVVMSFFEATAGFSGQEDLRWPTRPHMLHVGGFRGLVDFLLAVGCGRVDGDAGDAEVGECTPMADVAGVGPPSTPAGASVGHVFLLCPTSPQTLHRFGRPAWRRLGSDLYRSRIDALIRRLWSSGRGPRPCMPRWMARRRSSVIFTSLRTGCVVPWPRDPPVVDALAVGSIDSFRPPPGDAPSPSASPIPSAFFRFLRSLGLTSVLDDRSMYSGRLDQGTQTGQGRKPADVRIIRRPPHSLHSFVDRMMGWSLSFLEPKLSLLSTGDPSPDVLPGGRGFGDV